MNRITKARFVRESPRYSRLTFMNGLLSATSAACEEW